MDMYKLKSRFNVGYKISSLVLGLVLVSVVAISMISYNRFMSIAISTLGKEQVRILMLREQEIKMSFLLPMLLVIFLAVGLAIVFSRVLTKPIISIKENLGLMEIGILPQEIAKSSNDEIGEMANIMNNLVQSLKLTAEFAHSIGEGKLNASFKPLSESDVLGNSLLNMQRSLMTADVKEKERGWIVNGVAEIGEILRRHTLIEPLSFDIIKYMVEKIHGIQGAFYCIEFSEDDPSARRIVMKNCYAYNRKKYLNTSFKIGEGLVGQAAFEAATVFRTEIPDNYCTITSGLLKDKKPKSILIVPLITDDEIYGLLEFASLNQFNENEIRFVEEVGPIIARTIFNIHVNERTQRHLEISQKMSSELQQQQEELRQNAEEMQAAQEDLQQANQNLEEQIEEVNRTQKRMQSLLENASEVISIYEVDGRIRYVSPSVKNILGIRPETLVGSKDEVNIHEDDLDEYKLMFKKLLVSPDLPVAMQYRYKKENGEWIWLEASGKNLISDTAVKGIVINSRDITLKRKAEVEERMRKNMQALSENSCDLITRLSSDGYITYTNPIIENYTGSSPSEFINNNLETIQTGNGIVASWKEILQEVLSSNDKVFKEVSYSSSFGDRMMSVNAIPEYNDSALESVLVVSHDITAMKQIESEIKAKNKSIHESITYSKRIQNAIIPDNNTIQKCLPNSFIMYNPKDIVSGDFPWFMQKNDTVYLSVVDCTGHGVPGAMLSLVGFFQLNNIVDKNHSFTSAEILDEFDKKVNETLIKDTNGENIKDGMDIAFCKINVAQKTVEYSGAHRPLYLLSNDEISEFKGDKWAIGGGVYKNQTHFTNHKITVKKGDTIFFFSDGFPDQFGGGSNRKFGTSRMKEIMLRSKGKPMKDVHQDFAQEFSQWRGEGKQTDDVLLIGIRF